jgi:serine/threonine protein kinase
VKIQTDHERRVEELFHRAILLAPEERGAWLVRECSAEPALGDEVRALLGADERVARDFLERGAAHGPAIELVAGARLGSYTLLERLGEGGMGVVYLAREAGLERDVALKIVRPDLLSFGHARERLRREVEAIARLKHPNILPVYSAGEEAGVPFFTMEFVEGCTLSEVLAHLNRRPPAELTAAALSGAVDELARTAPGELGELRGRRAATLLGATWTGASCRIALALAEALEHAHERGILHRDVKPSNVMLTRDGRVLLLDFGLAASSEPSELTLTGHPVGTLPYMPPERLRGESETSGAKGDVYAVGVLLFELLTLRSPYQAPDAEVTRARILEAQPPAIRSLNPQVPWDAETVCLTAMERDPARRYASAGALAEDLANVLARRPIRARRPGPMLRARRYVERHPVASVAAALGGLLLAASAAFALLQSATNRRLRLANQDKDVALGEKSDALADARKAAEDLRTALARKDEINAILGSMIGAPDPWQTDLVDPIARDTTVVEVLERARADLASGRALDPAVEQDVSRLLGGTYVELGMFPEAERLLERALLLARELYGDESEETIRASVKLGVLRMRQRRLDESIGLLEKALESAERLLPPGDRLTRAVSSHLANTCAETGDVDRAEELLRRPLGMLAHPAGAEEELERAVIQNNLGALLVFAKDDVEGVELIEQALELRKRHLPANHAHILASQHELGTAWIQLRHFAEAAALLESTVAEMESVLGAGNEWTLFARASLAHAFIELERYEEAEAQGRAVLAQESNFRGPGHPVPIFARIHLATSLLAQGRIVEAEAFSAEAVDLARAGNASDRTSAAVARRKILVKLAALEPGLLDELAALQAEHGSVHDATYRKLRELVSVLVALGKREDALLFLEEGLAEWKDARPQGSEEIDALEQQLLRCKAAPLPAAFPGQAPLLDSGR